MIKNIFSTLKEHLSLLIDSPKDYLYSYTANNNDAIRIEEFDPKSKLIGERFVAKINYACPELPVYFVGSANLEIAGKRDIDLYIACPFEQFELHLSQLTTFLGSDFKRKKEFIEWHITEDDFNIDVVLISPDNKRLLSQIRLFNLLKENSDYLREYEKLKISSNGLSSRVYNRRRMAFFNKILK